MYTRRHKLLNDPKRRGITYELEVEKLMETTRALHCPAAMLTGLFCSSRQGLSLDMIRSTNARQVHSLHSDCTKNHRCPILLYLECGSNAQ